MRKILPKVVLVALCSFVVAATVNQDAAAFAFLLDPAKHPNNLFGRELWDIAPTITPTKKNVVILPYALVPNLNQQQFEWTASDGTKYTSASFGWDIEQAKKVGAAATTWNAGVGKNDNVKGVKVDGGIDLQSTALHEFGHALGLDHPAWVNSLVPQLSYLISPRNLNANGTPFTDPVPAKVDKDTIQLNLTKVQVDGVIRPLAVGKASTEAVMVQGAFSNEAQVELAFDDEQGLHALQSGVDFVVNTDDDFTFLLALVPYESGKQVINVVNAKLWQQPQGAGGRTYYSPKTNIGKLKWSWTPDKIDKSLVVLDELFDPSGSYPEQVVGLTEVWQDYPSSDGSIYTGGVTIYLDAGIPVSVPSSLVLMLGGLSALWFANAARKQLPDSTFPARGWRRAGPRLT